MPATDTLTGRLRADARSILLDKPLPETAVGKPVRITLEVIEPEPAKRPIGEVLDEIWADLKASGHVPPTKEEVDRYIEEERNSWD